MKIAAIIVEYNPFHRGHVVHINKTRSELDNNVENTGIICVMSGNYVQRGDFAVMNKWARAQSALCPSGALGEEDGADLVLELPMTACCSSAEGFARGAVGLIDRLGVVDYLSFGSESGDLDKLMRISDSLIDEKVRPLLASKLSEGVSFPVARQAAAEQLIGEDALLLKGANNILAVEYLKALKRLGSDIAPMTVLREGAGHDSMEEGLPSAAKLRAIIRKDPAEAAALLPARTAALLKQEHLKGCAPVTMDGASRMIMSRLRSMSLEDFAAVPDSGEGLHHRMWKYSRSCATVDSFIGCVKTKRYTYSRISRMTVCAFLGLTKEHMGIEREYARVLALNDKGRKIMNMIEQKSNISLISRYGQLWRCADSPGSAKLLELETRATDLYTLSYANNDYSIGAQEKTQQVIYIP